jgi:hypothetical protein
MASGIFLDLASNAVVQPGNTFTTAVTGGALTTVDLVDCVANMYTVVISCTTVTSSGNVTFKVQQSIDGTTWTDVSGAVTTAFSATNTTQILSFQNVGRYTRLFSTLNSGTSINVVSLFLGQRQTTPANSGGFSNAAAGV